jgi:hypothetical protein
MAIVAERCASVKSISVDPVQGTVTFGAGSSRETFPIVEGHPVPGSYGQRVTCPYCGGRHVHGPPGGTRLAHCGRGEYYLRPTGSTAPFVGRGCMEKAGKEEQP